MDGSVDLSVNVQEYKDISLIYEKALHNGMRGLFCMYQIYGEGKYLTNSSSEKSGYFFRIMPIPLEST